MRNMQWRKVALAMLSGSILFQLPGCTEAAIYIGSVASAITAGGVLYLVRRVID
jgi:hypothetical protein